jgi:hypothetical protein
MDLIVRKIKALQRIQPNASWLQSQRSFLLSEISRSQKPIKNRKNFLVFPVFNFSKIFRPAFAFAFSIIILISSLTTVGVISAAQNSLPGDMLYPIKTAIEKTQLSFTADRTNRTKLSIKFATQRLDEFTQLLDKSESKADIQKTVKKFTEEIVAVREEINTLKEKNAEKAAEVAKLINAQTPIYEESLNKGTEKLGYILPGEKESLTQEINQALEEVSKMNEATKDLVKEEPTTTSEPSDSEPKTPEEILVPGDKAEQTESSSTQFESIQPSTE